MNANTPTRQRALLLRLADLTAEQEAALGAGDMDGLTLLAEVRSKTVHDAAAFVPPYCPWTPEVTDLAAQVQQRSAGLQQQIAACMAAVRRELVELSRNQRVSSYITADLAGQGASWRG